MATYKLVIECTFQALGDPVAGDAGGSATITLEAEAVDKAAGAAALSAALQSEDVSASVYFQGL